MAAVTQIGALIDFAASTTIVSADVEQNFDDIRTQFNRLVNAAGGLYVGDDADGNTTLGITVNQGTNTDKIMAFKQSTIAHGLTSLAETDTYGAFGLADSDGGLSIFSYAEDSASVPKTLTLVAYGGQAQTSQTTSNQALVDISVLEHDGAGSVANITAGGNVWSVRAWVGGAMRALWFLTEDGNWYYDGADGGAFDTEDDGALLRAFALATAPKDVIRTEWDALVRYRETDLVAMGVLSETVENGGLVNGAQLQRALVGNAWQTRVMIEEIRAKMEAKPLRRLTRWVRERIGR